VKPGRAEERLKGGLITIRRPLQKQLSFVGIAAQQTAASLGD
jgi:hypothetical protein